MRLQAYINIPYSMSVYLPYPLSMRQPCQMYDVPKAGIHQTAFAGLFTVPLQYLHFKCSFSANIIVLNVLIIISMNLNIHFINK